MTTRERLQAVLAEQGYDVVGTIAGAQSWNLRPPPDFIRWRATATTVSGKLVKIMSHATMSACVRYGIRLEPAAVDGFDYEVIAFRPVVS